MRPARVLLPLLLSLLAAAWGPATAQVCHDWDGDGEVAGWQCATAADCEDRSWHRRPGGPEPCNGLDDDCDGAVDQTCDRWCDELGLLWPTTPLEIEGLPRSRNDSGCAALTDRGFVVGTARDVDPTVGVSWLVYARGYDRYGSPWAPSSAVGEPEISPAEEVNCEMAAGGDRALIAWQDDHLPDEQDHRLMARVVDDLGTPLGSPIDLSATAPVGSDPWHHHDVVWDGERFVVFWAPGGIPRNNLLMSVIHPDGTPADPTTTIVTGDVDGDGTRRTIQQIRATWTGEHFVLFFWVNTPFEESDNMRTLKVSRGGNPAGPANVLSTDPQKGGNPTITRGGGRLGIVWSAEEGDGTFDIWLAFLDLDGNFLAPPGKVHLMKDSREYAPANLRLAWTGEMYGVALARQGDPFANFPFRWHFWRVLPDGTVLDPGGVLLDEGTGVDNILAYHWSGSEFWLFATRNDDRFVRDRITCSCQDLDGDGLNACEQGDCDDSDPLIRPLVPEVCRGHRDDNCDGDVDCDDGSCPGGAGPGDVSDLRWEGAGLVWSEVASAERYDLARGLLGEVRRRGDLRQAECAGVELSAASWADDGREPPAGEALWYLVRPEGAPCELGTWGAGSGGREISACR